MFVTEADAAAMYARACRSLVRGKGNIGREIQGTSAADKGRRQRRQLK